MAGLRIVKQANRGACILEFEGATVRSDVLDYLRAIVAEPMSAPELARMRVCSAGSTANTMQRLTDLGLADATRKVARWAGKFAERQRIVAAFVISDKGKRLLADADTMKDELAAYSDDEESGPSWPRQDATDVVRQAMQTQPNSIFDMGRVCHVDDTPPVVAQAQRAPINSVWKLATA